LDIIAKIGQPNLGIVFDSYHLGQDENVIDWLPSIVPLIRLVQLGDARGAPLGEQNRCMLGEGYLPLSSIVQVIESYEYSGFYEVELVGEDMESYDYDRLLADSRKKMVEFSAHS
jgi:sugar phosphate isomerase/epimerase